MHSDPYPRRPRVEPPTLENRIAQAEAAIARLEAEQANPNPRWHPSYLSDFLPRRLEYLKSLLRELEQELRAQREQRKKELLRQIRAIRKELEYPSFGNYTRALREELGKLEEELKGLKGKTVS